MAIFLRNEDAIMKTNPVALGLLCAAMAFTALSFSAMPVNAEILSVGDAGAVASSSQTPRRGASQASVAAHYGEPRERFAAVGQPPITRWVYDTFTVYFEGDHVIHAVLTSK